MRQDFVLNVTKMLVIWPAIGREKFIVKNAIGNYMKLNKRSQRKSNRGLKMSVESANCVNMRSIHMDTTYQTRLIFVDVNNTYGTTNRSN